MEVIMRLLALAVVMQLAGCAIFKGPDQPAGDTAGGGDGGAIADGGTADGGTTGDGGGGGDGGGDGGTTGDGGGDGGTTGDGGGDGGSDPLCDGVVHQPAATDECVYSRIHCGETVTGNTSQGTTLYDYYDYLAWYCLNRRDGNAWKAPERVYEFEAPEAGIVEFTLYSPCAEMDLRALRWDWWDSDGDCPTEDSTLAVNCEVDDGNGDTSVVTVDASKGNHYLVFVDGVDGAEDNFQLTVTCD
ncbi:MAG: hypothetical protein D6798_18880 [Deltaproteobacteria bacterium]|nr:MAG: hypothetical protein D6798_18880 [Deltaproteobacteria bacterium]